MKKLAIILLLSISALSVFAQDPIYDESERKNDQAQTQKQMQTAAHHLKRAGINLQLSIGASFLSGVAVYGATLKDVDDSTRDLLYVGAGAAAIGSLVAYLSGVNHIKRAGQAMEKSQRKLSLSPTQNGYGIVYRF